MLLPELTQNYGVFIRLNKSVKNAADIDAKMKWQ